MRLRCCRCRRVGCPSHRRGFGDHFDPPRILTNASHGFLSLCAVAEVRYARLRSRTARIRVTPCSGIWHSGHRWSLMRVPRRDRTAINVPHRGHFPAIAATSHCTRRTSPIRRLRRIPWTDRAVECPRPRSTRRRETPSFPAGDKRIGSPPGCSQSACQVPYVGYSTVNRCRSAGRHRQGRMCVAGRLVHCGRYGGGQAIS